MIKYIKGNLLSAHTEALVNTVNTVGVMGKGIALQFKERYPDNFKAYVIACKEKRIFPGKSLVVKDRYQDEDVWIINFPTKVDWRKKSQYSYIEEGLNIVKEYYIAVVLDRTMEMPIFIASTEGGMEIEEVAEKNPEKIIYL